MSKLTLKVRNGDGPGIWLKGREAQTMALLIARGDTGISSLHHPGIRLAHYIFKLRGYGFLIETQSTPHGGDFAGHHAVYVLKSRASIVSGDERRAHG